MLKMLSIVTVLTSGSFFYAMNEKGVQVEKSNFLKASMSNLSDEELHRLITDLVKPKQQNEQQKKQQDLNNKKAKL